MDSLYMILIIWISTLLALWIIFYIIPIGLWFTALVSNVKISLLDLVLMKWRKMPVQEIVNSLIALSKAGITLGKEDLVALYQSGGNVTNVSNGLIRAKVKGIDLSYREAIRLDFAKKNIVQELEKVEETTHNNS